MAGSPIMTMLHEGHPDGRIVRIGWDTAFGSGGGYFVMPDDGRDYQDIPTGELRPYPAFDVMQQLSLIANVSLGQMLAVCKSGVSDG